MAAFNDALDLKTAVGDHVGNRSISDVWPRLVEMAEDDLNSKLRTRDQLMDYTLSFDAGEAALPPDFLEVAAFPDGRGGECYPRYSIDGFTIRLPSRSGDMDFRYYSAIPSLSCSLSATNWLLRKFPNVYLYGVALQAAKYLKDVEMAQATDQLYSYALQSMRIADERARWANSVVRVAGLTP